MSKKEDVCDKISKNDAVLREVGKVLSKHGTTQSDVVPSRQEAKTIEHARDIIRNRKEALAKQNPEYVSLGELKDVEKALSMTLSKNDLSYLTPEIMGKLQQEVSANKSANGRHCNARQASSVDR